MPRGLGSAISPGTKTFNGSIAVDKIDVIINFNASGRSLLPPGDYFVVHRRTRNRRGVLLSSPLSLEDNPPACELKAT
jgi:hypothetical protein